MDAYRELLRIAELPAGGTSLVAGIGHVGIAEVAYQRGDLAAARRALQTGVPLCRQLSDTQALANGLATLAWIRQAEGDPAGARQAMNKAERAGPSPAAAGLLNPVPAQRARLALAQGDIAAAARWAQQQRLSPDSELAYTGERDQLVLARLLLAQDQPHQALRLLGPLSALAASQGRTGSIIEIAALRALALAAAGDRAAAAQELARTLALAAPQGYLRVFADEGPPMAALLSQVAAAHRDGQPAARQVPLGYLAAALKACAPAGQAPGVPGLAEPLTARELEVLHLLAAGAPNRRIADDLVVTLDAVKKHVTPRARQARRGQPHRSRHPRPPARPDLLAPRHSRFNLVAHYADVLATCPRTLRHCKPAPTARARVFPMTERADVHGNPVTQPAIPADEPRLLPVP